MTVRIDFKPVLTVFYSSTRHLKLSIRHIFVIETRCSLLNVKYDSSFDEFLTSFLQNRFLYGKDVVILLKLQTSNFLFV